MDEKQFDELVTRFASGSSRRDSVKALLAAALATVGVPSLAEARKGKGKDRRTQGRDHKGKDKHHKSKAERARTTTARARLGKLARGGFPPMPERRSSASARGRATRSATRPPASTASTRGRSARRSDDQIRNQFPFSFRVSSGADCPSTAATTTTTPAPTTPAPTTTPRADDDDRGADLQRAVVYRGWQRQPEHLRAVRDELRLPLTEQHHQRLLHDGDGVRRHAMHHRHLTQQS